MKAKIQRQIKAKKGNRKQPYLITLDTKLLNSLKKKCKRDNISVNLFISNLIWNEVE